MYVIIGFLVLVAAFIIWWLFFTARDIFIRQECGGRIRFVVHRKWKRVQDPFAPLSLLNVKDNSTIQITPFPKRIDSDVLRHAIEVGAKRDEASSAEVSIIVSEIQAGAQLRGYYYFSTDRKVRPGGWAFKMSGSGVIGETTLNFTILSHNAYPEGMKEGFEMLLNAKMAQ